MGVSGRALVRANEFNSLNLLRQLMSKSMPMLSDSIEINRTGSHIEVEFCPDNTCEIFRAPANSSMKKLNDFVYLYLFYASGYTYLEMSITDSPPFRKSGRKYASSVLRRNASGCKQTDELELASCILRSLANENGIQVAFVRYDEGGWFEGPEDLNKTLSLGNLKSIRALHEKNKGR